MSLKFIKSEDAQTYGLFPIIAIILIAAFFFVYNIGDYYFTYTREQNALDAAVYSGAAMQADALNATVKINKLLFAAYTTLVGICTACIIMAALTGCWPPVFPCCRGAGTALTVAEKIARATSTMLNKGNVAYSAAAMKIYKKSGGRATLPYYGVFVTTLKLDKVYNPYFARPKGYPPFLVPLNTFMGMSEKKTKDIYDWAGGGKAKPHVYGPFGQPKEKTSGGRYDKRGPYTTGWVRIKFTPTTGLFNKFKRNIFLAAKARPYGGNVHREIKMGPMIWGLFPWGNESFKAKLVPLRY